MNPAFPPSETEAFPMVRDGVASSSVMLKVASVTVRPEAAPERVIASLGSSRVSCVGVSVNVFRPLNVPAEIVTATGSTAV